MLIWTESFLILKENECPSACSQYPTTIPILSQLSPVHTTIQYFFKIHFNGNTSSIRRYISHHFQEFHMCRPSYPPLVLHYNSNYASPYTTIFSNFVSLPRPYKARDKITVLYILIFTLLYRRWEECMTSFLNQI